MSLVTGGCRQATARSRPVSLILVPDSKIFMHPYFFLSPLHFLFLFLILFLFSSILFSFSCLPIDLSLMIPSRQAGSSESSARTPTVERWGRGQSGAGSEGRKCGGRGRGCAPAQGIKDPYSAGQPPPRTRHCPSALPLLLCCSFVPRRRTDSRNQAQRAHRICVEPRRQISAQRAFSSKCCCTALRVACPSRL